MTKPVKKNKNQIGKNVSLLQKIAKVDNLPKDIASSIPFRGFIDNTGVIETKSGVFTKTYKIEDANFNFLSEDEQENMIIQFTDFINTFGPSVKWEITFFNQSTDKKKMLEDVKMRPVLDGLNKYRKEMNDILVDNLKKGNSTITHNKYFTISVEDTSVDRAITTLNTLDSEVSRGIEKITGKHTKPLTTVERMRLLYNIYNQDYDYRNETYEDESVIANGIDLEQLKKMGLSPKDFIGPSSIDYSPQGRKDMFMIGDTYAQALYLKSIPNTLSTNFLKNLVDIQSNLLVSITAETIDKTAAQKMAKNQIATIEGNISKRAEKAAQNGDFSGALPPELERSQQAARELFDDITENDQQIFFISVIVVAFAPTKKELSETVAAIKRVANQHMCTLSVAKFDQEFMFNTALPLCRKDIFYDLMYPSGAAAVFLPFDAEEISDENAIFYGLNEKTKSMVLYNRVGKKNNNFNGFIFGCAGSGKSFTAKTEMVSVLLNKPNSQIFVIDPQGEYSPMVKAFGGEELVLSPGCTSYLNPLDLNIMNTDGDPVADKVDFVIGFLDLILSKGRDFLDAEQQSVIDESCKEMYEGYLNLLKQRKETFNPALCPTLMDLQSILSKKSTKYPNAYKLVKTLQLYTNGTYNIFSKRTNIETNNRFISYNIKKLGTNMLDLGLFVSLNDIFNRIMINEQKGIYTWVYIDEFHILLNSENTTKFVEKLWKIARKWKGVLTGITQNTEDLWKTTSTRNIFNNTNFVLMLKNSKEDRENLKSLLNLSDTQIEFLRTPDKGHGLLYNGNSTIPFGLDFPKNTELYSLITTSGDAKEV